MASNLMDTPQHPPSFLVITPEECVKGCLKDLGYEVETYGHWRHVFTNILMKTVPNFVYFYK